VITFRKAHSLHSTFNVAGHAAGIPIYSLKVLSSDGTGTTSDLLRAYEWLYYNARALGIRVVNLSLTGGGGATDPQCEWTSALAQQGITVVAAAGNNRANLMQEAPGACAKALVVSGQPSDVASVVAAPAPPAPSGPFKAATLSASPALVYRLDARARLLLPTRHHALQP
jgi:subtilisin family serine protease